MNRIPHSPHHWIAVAAVLALSVFALQEVHGQAPASGAAAMYQGKPAMAGAQSGLGAMAGLPQGGIGVQGNDGAMVTVTREGVTNARREAIADDSHRIEEKKDIAPPPSKDNSLAKEQRSATKKVVRGAKRTVNQARHGVSTIGAQ